MTARLRGSGQSRLSERVKLVDSLPLIPHQPLGRLWFYSRACRRIIGDIYR